jgi:hypothetical protein
VVIRQWQEVNILNLLVSAGRNVINNLVQNQIPITSIQTYQNASQIVTITILTHFHISPKLILLIILFL